MRARASVLRQDLKPTRPQSIRWAVPVLLTALAIPAAAQAPIVPSGFSTSLLAGGMLNPTAMAFAPDGRLFICQQGGALRVVKNGALLSTPFMTLSVNSAGERGLLGITFDPNFATNRFVYVYYTVPSAPIHNRISRFTASGDVAVSGSEFVLMDLDNLSTATNHNGGAIHFGPDGTLYVGVGENATGANAQSLSTRLGKILRINSNGTIPTNNPFYGSATGANRAIWAMGLRNPFTLQFEPGTSRLFINDVGQNTWEEINNGVAGANYGWPTTEGEFTPSAHPGHSNPLLAYDHSGSACAITGGAFMTGANFPASYRGRYFYPDHCAGWIRTYDRTTDTSAAFASGLRKTVDLKVGPDSALYVLQRGSGSNTGSVYRISSGGSSSSTLTLGATTVGAGQPIQVTVANGPGSPTDWVGMQAVSAADTAWLDWKYLNGTRSAPTTGLTSAVLTFTAPSMPGTYNFRFYQNGSYAKLATSATFTVTGSSSGPSLTVSTTSAMTGQVIQVMVANGPGSPRDWVGLYVVSAGDTGWVDWKYMNGTRSLPASGMTSATISFTLPPTAGTYEFRFFANGTYTRLATSAAVTVQSAGTPTLTVVGPTTVSRGASVQVQVANGPGNVRDWIGLYASTSADMSWLDWKYLNGTRTPPATGMASATVTFTMPQTMGTYNFRFFRDDGFMKLATSATLTVQ